MLAQEGGFISSIFEIIALMVGADVGGR